jgi:hypothetical protein
MSAYVVKWVRHARTLLATAWLAAGDRNAVTRAQNAIDKALAAKPKSVGRELSDGLWRIERPPLVAFFEIDDTNNTVTVTDLAYIP